MEIKTMSVPRLVRAVHSIGIELTGSNPFNPDVPHITGAVAGRIEINHSGGRCVLRDDQTTPDELGWRDGSRRRS